MTDIDMGHWVLADGIEFQPDALGFVYIIKMGNGQKYIGKKLIHTVKKLPPLKGKTKKRHVVVETDWRKYTSSSTTINEYIKIHGKDSITFTILQFCNSKSHLAYREAELQFEHKVLFDDTYLNQMINIRLSRIKI